MEFGFSKKKDCSTGANARVQYAALKPRLREHISYREDFNKESCKYYKTIRSGRRLTRPKASGVGELVLTGNECLTVRELRVEAEAAVSAVLRAQPPEYARFFYACDFDEASIAGMLAVRRRGRLLSKWQSEI